MSVLIFTPTWIDPATDEDAILPECEASIKAQVFDEFDWHVTTDNPWPIGDYRNVLHQYAMARLYFLQGKWEALLTVEHDNVLPDPEALQRMASTMGDVIYAPYLLRHNLRVLSIFRYPGSHPPAVRDSLSYYQEELTSARQAVTWRCSGAGFGCTLIRRRVLERIEFTGATQHDMNACPDLRFVEDCERAGFQSFARFDVPVDHLENGERLQPYTRRELRKMRQANAEIAAVPVSHRNRARTLGR